MPRSPRAADVALSLPDNEAPLRHRVADALVAAIAERRLRPGDDLPSTRVLADRLGVSRAPVVAAYDELAAAGFVVSTPGSGAVVAPGADLAARAGAGTHVAECPPSRPAAAVTRAGPVPVRWDLRPGRPDTSLIDPTAWRRAWRRAGGSVPGHDAGEPPAHAELRTALADHLRRTRGIAADADRLLVVPGVAATLHALPAALGLVDRRVALEDPGYAEAWTAFARAGARLVAVPVDEDGLDPARLPARTAAVYVTPSHQYPLGARMPVTRRADLLAWAERQDGIVIEDDYDGEFRYDVSPLPALRSLPGAEERVVYVGTASKLIAPTLRVAWLLPPPHLLEPLRRELHRRELVVNEATGLALADFFGSGAAAAHHARAGRTYAARRARLVRALERHLPELGLCGVDAGLHLVLRLPDDAPDHEVVDDLAGRGLAANPLSAYAVDDDRVGLVLGYAGLPETQADAAVRTLAEVVRPLLSR